MAAPVSNVLATLQSAGLTIAPNLSGGLRAVPARRLTPELRGLIHTGKADILQWFTKKAANEMPEPMPELTNWRELDAAYKSHHFKCPTCIAAGRGPRYGHRCWAGAALWLTYSA